MSTRRNIRTGQTITLRARFQDDLGDNVEASNVYVHIFEPDADTSDLANALVVSGVATYFGEGIHEYPYSIPTSGPSGTWTDKWEGVLTSQSLDESLTFEVVDSGVISQLGSQIHQNNVIQVTLHSGVFALDGSYTSDEYSFSFLTNVNPAYTNTRKVRLEAGAFIQDISEDTLQLGILEASLEADAIKLTTSVSNQDFYNHARREWVTCKTAMILLTNGGSSILRSKTVADITVSYDTRGVRDMLDRILNCIDKWEGQLITGGTKNSSRPRGVIKGEYDPDRPSVGRGWNNVSSSDRMPAANDRELVSTSRRARGAFKKNRWW